MVLSSAIRLSFTCTIRFPPISLTTVTSLSTTKPSSARCWRTSSLPEILRTVTVAKLHGEGPVKRRIMDMGITKGVEIFVRKVAPLGDPMELNVRGYELSVRKGDAEMIEVQ